jgi:hypothetical protein
VQATSHLDETQGTWDYKINKNTIDHFFVWRKY